MRYAGFGFELPDALAEFASEGFEVRSRYVAQGPAEKFLADGGEPSGQVGELLVGGSGEFGVTSLPVVEDGGVNPGLSLAVPGDEGGFGDAEPAGDTGKAQSLDAEAEEFRMGREGVHGA